MNFYTDIKPINLYLKFALLFYVNFKIIKLLKRPPLTLRAPGGTIQAKCLFGAFDTIMQYTTLKKPIIINIII